jgi:DNA-binding MarR family transcriptional regulator
MDRSALARSLKPLEDQGLLTVEPGHDRRTRLVRLTEQGRHALARTLPSWRQAQEQLIVRFGEQQARLLLAELKSIESLSTSIEQFT